MNTVMDDRWSPTLSSIVSALERDSGLDAKDLQQIRRVVDARLKDAGNHFDWCHRHYYDAEFGHNCTSEWVEFEHGEGDDHEGAEVALEGTIDERPGISLEIFTERGGPDLSDNFSWRQAHIMHRLLTNAPAEAAVAIGKLLDSVDSKRDEVSER